MCATMSKEGNFIGARSSLSSGLLRVRAEALQLLPGELETYVRSTTPIRPVPRRRQRLRVANKTVNVMRTLSARRDC